MTWVENRRLWRKVYRGKVYTVSCKQLREAGHEVMADTKEGSRVAANGWWNKKWFDLEAQEKAARRPPLPMEDVMRAWVPADFYDDDQKARAYAGYLTPQEERQAVEELANRHRAMGIKVEVRPPTTGEPSEEEKRRILSEAHERAVLDFVRRHLLGNEPLPPSLAEKLPPGILPRVEAAVSTLAGKRASPERTVEAYSAAWLRGQELRVEAGEMSVGGYDNKRRWIGGFLDFVGRTSDVATVTDSLLDALDTHCLNKRAAHQRGEAAGWSDYFCRDVRATTREFVRWLSDRNVIPRPAWLTRKSRRFRLAPRDIEYWTPQEFQAALQAAHLDRIKLMLLLGANCGMTQKDSSDLLDREVDWEAGYIQRRRSKSKQVHTAPSVRYKLWPTTLELLRKCRSGGKQVITTNRGTSYVRGVLKGGKAHRGDSFWAYFRHLKERVRKTIPNFNKTPKGVRKMAATLLEGNKDYARFVGHFLGHAPKDMAHRHYTPSDQPLFDEAVTWLGRQVGQVP
jgi:integrase